MEASQDGALEQWWQALTSVQRTILLEADLEQPLAADLVDIVRRAHVFVPMIATWFGEDTESASWHATSIVRDFVKLKREES